MAKLKYRVRILLGDQELVLLVPAAPATTVGELQADILARARRKGVLGSACELFVDGASLDELDSVEDVLEVEQTIDAKLSPLRECNWSAADLAALVREGFSPALRHTIVETHASLAAFRRSPDGSRLMPSRVTPAKRAAPEDDCVAAPAPADEDESDEEYVWPAEAPRGDALVGSRVRVWWPHDRAWFSGSVNAFDGTKLYEVTYTDGSLWDEDLAERRWELLDESALKAHEREFLRVERLRLAGKVSLKNSVDGGIYRRFYELTGTTGQTPYKQQLLRERTRLIIEPFLDAPVADAADEESDDAPPPPRKRAAPADAESSEEEERSAASATTWPQVGTWVRDAKAIRGPGDNPIGGTGAEGMVVCIHNGWRTILCADGQELKRHPPSLCAAPGAPPATLLAKAAKWPPSRKRAAPVDAAASGRASRPRRGRAPAELVSEKEFGGLWAQLTAKGWKVLPKPHSIAPGDPRTWIWCAPEVVEHSCSGGFQLRSRDAGKIGESIFLDKDDVWVWAVRKGLVVAPPRRRPRVESSDEDESARPPRRRARTEAPAPDYRDEDSSDGGLVPRPVRTEAPDYRESKGTSGRLTFRYKTPMCGKCSNCLDKPKFGGTGKSKQACVLRLRERAVLLEAGSAHPPPVRRRDPNLPCTICFAVVAEADAVFGSDVCSHVFHRECIEGWARECAERPHNVATRRGVRVSCPNCKKGTRVRAGPVEEGDDCGDGDESSDESEASELMAEAPAPTRGGHKCDVGAQVESVDDATVRGIITDSPGPSHKEVTTTTGEVVMFRSNQLARATLTAEEAARCIRPATKKDYVQARIDGVIRFSHDGTQFKNLFMCADGTERRQFEVSGNHVRCTLCPDARTWSLGTGIGARIPSIWGFRRHCGQTSDGHRRAAELHRERLLVLAVPRAPGPLPVASANEAGTVLGISLAQARVLAEAAAAGRLVPVREEASSAPNL